MRAKSSTGSARLGIPVGLATSSRLEEVQERLGPVAKAFTTITTRDNVRRGKPSPDIYVAAAASLGVEPSQCLALEDSFAGIRSATAAGMPVLMVPDLAQPTPEMTALVVAVFATLIDVRDALSAAWAGGTTEDTLLSALGSTRSCLKRELIADS